MKTLKNILLSLLISLLFSSGIVLIQILIESNDITKRVNRHFYNSNCICTRSYSDLVLGSEGIMYLTKLSKINSKEFKVELFEIDLHKKGNDFSDEFIEQQINQLLNDIIPEYLEDCSYRKEETNFIEKTARDFGNAVHFGTSQKEYNNYYNYKYYYIDVRDNDWNKDESSTENSYIKALVYKTNYYSYFKFDTGKFFSNILLFTGFGSVLVFIIILIFRKRGDIV